VHRSIPRSAALIVAVVLLVGAGQTTSRSIAGQSGGSPVLPDLKVVPLSDFHVQTLNGHRLLRFTTIVANRGPGPFEVAGSRGTTAHPEMRIKQVIHEEGGGKRWRRTGAIAAYAGDGHDHWHVQDVTSYELWPVGVKNRTLRGTKIGLCFFDNYAWRLSLPGARQRPHYSFLGCRRSGDALTIHAGISVGWGDSYPWNFAYQWIDITGLPGGRYMLRTTADQPAHYREARELNNCVWVRMRISKPSAGDRVRVLGRGADCAADSVTPVDDFPGSVTWNPSRQITFARGRYVGLRVNARGTVLRNRRVTLDTSRQGKAFRRATLPGRDGKWLYVVSGPFQEWWVRDTSRIDVIP
jgi:Lysyl oxidase